MSRQITTHADRIAMIERHQAGEPLAAIAADMALSVYTVRHWWRCYRTQGWAGVAGQRPGRKAAGPLAQFDSCIKYVTLRLKRQHPGWGPALIRLHLSRRASLAGKRLPQVSTIAAFLQPYLPRLRPAWRTRTHRPSHAIPRVQGVHERWQMDFKGDVHLPDGTRLRPFVVCDEFTGAPLAGIIHPSPLQRGNPPLTFRTVQADLRLTFTQWGLPAQVRMDRDPLWVGCSRLQWPGPLLLWLIGLGVTPIINRAHCPTDNGVVERRHRIWLAHVFSDTTLRTVQQVQAATDQAWRDRRDHLPSRNPHCQGRAPREAHPALAQPRVPYTPAHESQLFQMARVAAYLSQWDWQRKVTSQGAISLDDHTFRVSARHCGQLVHVRFEPTTAEFIVRAVDGVELKRLRLPTMSQAYLCGEAAQGGI